jgi:hypothetical protein
MMRPIPLLTTLLLLPLLTLATAAPAQAKTVGPAKPKRVAIKAALPSPPSGSADEKLLMALRRQFFLGGPTAKAAAQLAIAAATPKDPAIAKAHRLCVAAQRAITVGKTWLSGLKVAKGGWTDQRTGACMGAVMRQIFERKLVKRSVVGVNQLAKPPAGRAYGLGRCHREADDLSIRRVRPLKPSPLRRPRGVAKGTRADIIVRIDLQGHSSLAGVVNANPGPAARACYASVAGRWSKPHPTAYCRFIRCRF